FAARRREWHARRVPSPDFLLMRRGPKDRYRFSHQGKLTWLILGAVAPALIILMSILWFGGFSTKVQWTFTIIIFVFASGFISASFDHVVHPLQTTSNLL